MSDGVWSDVADEWAAHWGSATDPARAALIRATGVGPGVRVVDVGCGAGEFLARLSEAGADAIGVDPAARMRALAAAAGHDVRPGDAEHLPLPDGSVDVVVAVNALQFADDLTAALRECARVLAPGGRIGVAVWAEDARNDVSVVEAAVAIADGDEPAPGGPLREAGGLERAAEDAGLTVVDAGLADTPWRAADDDALVRGILLGEDPATIADLGPVVRDAAQPFRDDDGDGYLLRGAVRWIVAVPPT